MARCSGDRRRSTSPMSASSCGSPGWGRSASSDGLARPARLATPGLVHGDPAHPAVERLRFPKGAKGGEHGDERLLGGVRALVEGDGAADTADERSERVEELAHREGVAPLGPADQRGER